MIEYRIILFTFLQFSLEKCTKRFLPYRKMPYLRSKFV